MFQITFTIADTHFHAVGTGDTREDGRNVLVVCSDLKTGASQSKRMTEREVSTVVAVAMSGEDFDLPARMHKEAEAALEGLPVDLRPIP